MKFLILFFIIVVFVWFLFKGSRKQSSDVSRTENPDIKITVSTTSSRNDREPTDVGELTPAGNNNWI